MIMNDRSPELLAPAGNIEQALLSIESGCDAIYGGLKTWNARMRAENFSLEEYEKIMDICGNKGIKFYMTLNTLFTNEDVTNILRTFYRRQFTFPHSVIVADVGLLQMLSDEFPHINLHVSTQYGASNASDIQFLEQYNVSRVILARELALKEILNVRKVTNLELEVFGYGSQCICFSGQCLWSGITQECSGNRGRCVAPCRDFYQYNDSIGQFFYPQDINAVSIVKKFILAGIDSIKLEGRFRDAKKTAAVVKSFRDAIDNAFDNNYSISSESEKHNYYAGYLENRNPVHSMLNQINPRTELIQVPTKEYTDHDLIVPYDKNHSVCLGGEHASPIKYWYIKSFFGNKLTLNNNSISVELYFNKEKVLERINLFDNMGRQFSNMIERHDIIKSTVRNIVNTLVTELNFDIFQISSNRPEASEVFVNSEKLRIILRQFNHICQQNMKARMVTSYIELPTYNDYLQINTCDIFNYLRDKGYRNFIFDISSVDELKKFLHDSETDGNIVYRLPLLDFTNALNGILPYLYKKISWQQGGGIFV